MTKSEVLALLKDNRNARGETHWKKSGPENLKSFGIGLTQLRKLAKKIGKNHALAMRLWNSDVYDAKVIGALIDEPAKMTREQAEAQVEDVEFSMLSHVYCSCDAALAKTAFARELAVEWMGSRDHVRRRCGYLLLCELAKNQKNPELTDAFFSRYLDRIKRSIKKEENLVRDAMNTSMLGIGKRSAALNKKAIATAKAIGPVDVDYGDNSCKPMDVLQHLTSDYIRKKLRV